MKRDGFLWIAISVGLSFLMVQLYAYVMKSRATEESAADFPDFQEVTYDALILEAYDGLTNIIYVGAIIILCATLFRSGITKLWLRILVGVLLALAFIIGKLLYYKWFFQP